MIVIIMGVSGSGKSTLGRAVAVAAGGRFYDADDFHPTTNIQKMCSGEPLTEDDREPWLKALRREIERWMTEPGLTVLACSALTTQSRMLLGVGQPGIRLVFLDAPFHVIAARMRSRDHFMPVSLLQSQFETLERPADALVLDATAAPATLMQQVLEHVRQL